MPKSSSECQDIHTLIAQVAQHYHFPSALSFTKIIEQFVYHFFRWLFDLIRVLVALLPGTTDTRSVSDLIKLVLLCLGISAALILARIIYLRLWQLSKQQRSGNATPDRFLLTQSSSQWQKQAFALTHTKQWKEACRALLMASLRLLDEHEIVPFMSSGTNLEYWYALGQYQQIRRIFRSISDTVDRCWFGSDQATEDDFRNCLEYFRTIESEASYIVRARAPQA